MTPDRRRSLEESNPPSAEQSWLAQCDAGALCVCVHLTKHSRRTLYRTWCAPLPMTTITRSTKSLKAHVLVHARCKHALPHALFGRTFPPQSSWAWVCSPCSSRCKVCFFVGGWPASTSRAHWAMGELEVRGAAGCFKCRQPRNLETSASGAQHIISSTMPTLGKCGWASSLCKESNNDDTRILCRSGAMQTRLAAAG